SRASVVLSDQGVKRARVPRPAHDGEHNCRTGTPLMRTLGTGPFTAHAIPGERPTYESETHLVKGTAPADTAPGRCEHASMPRLIRQVTCRTPRRRGHAYGNSLHC